ncbi:MAG: UPF0158 family protein [bacterium]
MKKIRVEIPDLIEALENEWEGIYYYLDLLSGEIVKVSEDYCADETASQIDYSDSEKFLIIPPLSPEERIKIRENFLKLIDDENIRDKLELALTHRGPLRKFVEIVRSHDEVQRKWKQFQEKNMKVLIKKWINSLDVDIELI